MKTGEKKWSSGEKRVARKLAQEIIIQNQKISEKTLIIWLLDPNFG